KASASSLCSRKTSPRPRLPAAPKRARPRAIRSVSEPSPKSSAGSRFSQLEGARGMSGVNLPPLKTRKLGRTNVSVTELGLGTAPLGELFDKVDDDEAAGIIGAGWDGGVRYFDTSPWYGRGLAEHTLGRALYRKPRDHY